MAKEVSIDLHGYHPSDVSIGEIVLAAWECGMERLTLIHGHGHNRGMSVGFVNTNTGYFGLAVRSAFRHDKNLRRWIYYSTMDCSHDGLTTVRLKPNPSPARSEFKPMLPVKTYRL